MLRVRANCTVMEVAPRALKEVISVTPGIWPSCRSKGVATEDAIVSALAPVSVAVTCTVGKSTCGKDAIGKYRNAVMPKNAKATISKEVATGRRMNGSDMFIVGPLVLRLFEAGRLLAFSAAVCTAHSLPRGCLRLSLP